MVTINFAISYGVNAEGYAAASLIVFCGITVFYLLAIMTVTIFSYMETQQNIQKKAMKETIRNEILHSPPSTSFQVADGHLLKVDDIRKRNIRNEKLKPILVEVVVEPEQNIQKNAMKGTTRNEILYSQPSTSFQVADGYLQKDGYIRKNNIRNEKLEPKLEEVVENLKIESIESQAKKETTRNEVLHSQSSTSSQVADGYLQKDDDIRKINIRNEKLEPKLEEVVENLKVESIESQAKKETTRNEVLYSQPSTSSQVADGYLQKDDDIRKSNIRNEKLEPKLEEVAENVNTESIESLSQNKVSDYRKACNYFWHVVNIAIFYGIPVVQLVFTYQKVINQTGEIDACYFNFRCANPVGMFSDFNHFFSNIGYVLLGILFVIMVLVRHSKMRTLGIKVNYGIFYAMGTTMACEGVLSACYHMCPNASNFQFGTSFLYLTAMLCMVKLYQNRHSDLMPSAYSTFAILAGIVLLGMATILNNNHIVLFGFLVIIFYTILSVFISFKIYFLGTILDKVKKMLAQNGYNLLEFPGLHGRGSVYVIVIANIANLGLLVCGIVFYIKDNIDFGTILLFLLMYNAILYSLFYTAMKFVHHERIFTQPIIYGLLGVCLLTTSFIFLRDNSKLWSVSPAQFRSWNQDCLFLNFYDKHDLWHLLSAGALYFIFMFLLCVDDDIIHGDRKNIAKF